MKNNKYWLLDTDVLVDYLRGYSKAVDFLETLKGNLLISAITKAELFSGVRDDEEYSVLAQFTGLFEIVPVDHEIAEKGGLFRRDYKNSHGTGLADALIAATAEFKNACLVTLNVRHFPMLVNVKVPYKKN